MKITNFGSCCIDNVYSVPHFVRPGETLPASAHEVHAGGKGLNQSLALALAGASVTHAGKVGNDGIWMKEMLNRVGVDTSLLRIGDGPSGHANIQVTPSGDNAIVIFGGANRTIDDCDIAETLATVVPGDFLLIQNEINHLEQIITLAHERDQRIVFNAAPMTDDVNDLPLDKVDCFIINEVEGEALTGKRSPDEILSVMADRFAGASTILTLGAEGAIYQDTQRRVEQPAFTVTPIDSTGAGDTFTGYFLAALAQEEEIASCLETACAAAAICTTKMGAATSIPGRDEVRKLIPRR